VTKQPASESEGSATAYDRHRAHLGRRVRDLRKGAGLTQVDLAARLGISQTTVSQIEAGRGRWTLTAPLVERLVEILGLASEVRTELLDHLAQLDTELHTWRVLHRSGHRASQARVGALEVAASVIRVFQAALVPGLLQTGEYARSMLELYEPDLRGIDELVAGRLQRQQVLYDTAKSFRFLITEGALRARVAPDPVLHGQLDRLYSLTGLDHVEIGVILTAARLQAFAMSSFHIVDDVVTIEMDTSQVVIRDPREVARYLDIFEGLRRSALVGPPAVEFIRHLQRRPGEL
jgi:transcriptional regulator with XRE-family HTH domain